MLLRRFQGSPVHVGTPFRAGYLARYPASYPPTIREEVPGCGLRFPAAFRLPAFASWTPCPARRNSAPITVGLPQAPRIPAHVLRTLAGFTRSTRVRPGPGRALSVPREQRCSVDHRVVRGRRLPPLNGRSLPPRYRYPTRDVVLTRHRQEFPVSRPPFLPLACDRHGWDSSPWAFPQAPHPTDQEPAAHAAVGTGRTPTRSYISRTSSTSSTSSLTTCDLVSQRPRTPPRRGPSRRRRRSRPRPRTA